MASTSESGRQPVRFIARTRQAFGGLLQLGLVVGFWLLGLAVCSVLGWPQLAGVAGMAALWLALRFNLVRVDQVRVGASWLLTHMLLFFIPAVLVVLDHRELLGWVGLKLFFAIALGTVIVMASTALSIEWCLRWSRRRSLARQRRAAEVRHVA